MAMFQLAESSSQNGGSNVTITQAADPELEATRHFMFEGSVAASTDLEAVLKVAIYLEHETESTWQRVARQFVADNPSESVKHFDEQKTVVKDVMMRTLAELPRYEAIKNDVLEIMERKKKDVTNPIPRRSKTRKYTPEMKALFAKVTKWESLDSTCRNYLQRIRLKTNAIVKEDRIRNLSPEEQAAEQTRRDLCTAALLLYKVIHFTPQPTALHWTTAQQERLNLEDSDTCGISGFLSSTDLIRVLSIPGLLNANTYFLDIG